MELLCKPPFRGCPALGCKRNYLPSVKPSLNPSFSGWPALGAAEFNSSQYDDNGLNPSFSGWPALGKSFNYETFWNYFVLIPLLVDDPLWAKKQKLWTRKKEVLIPLLVDDPLWAMMKQMTHLHLTGLNPSFSGWPALGEKCFTYNARNICLNPSFSGWPALGFNLFNHEYFNVSS